MAPLALGPAARAAEKNIAIVWGGPVGPKDIIHKDGEGLLSEPKDAKLKEGRFKWVVTSDASAAAAGAGAALRDQVRALCEKNFPAFPDLREPPNCCESTPGKVKTEGGATGCGGFPGWVIGQLGAEKFPKEPVKMSWTETVVVDGVKTYVAKSASVTVTARPSPGRTWPRRSRAGPAATGTLFIRTSRGGLLPKTGDI